jgi:integrin beta 3
MKTDELTVEAENVACSGAISESMNFLPSFTTEMPSCTKSLTMKFNDNAGQKRIIKLKQGGFVLLDGFEVSKLPWELDDGAVVIKQASSSFLVGMIFRFFILNERWLVPKSFKNHKLFSHASKPPFIQ